MRRDLENETAGGRGMTIFSPSDSAKKPERMEDGENGTSRRFDIPGLTSIPEPESDDPPYRGWWVIEDEQADRGR